MNVVDLEAANAVDLEAANVVDLEAAHPASVEMIKNSVDIEASEVEVPLLEVVLTYLLEVEVIDHPSRELEADSRVPHEVDSEAAPAVLALVSMTEKIERLYPLEEINLMRKAEASSNKDHSEVAVVLEAVTSVKEVAEECTQEEVVVVVALKEMMREVLAEEFLAPAPSPV